MDETLYAVELAGHCNELTSWRFLKEISEALRSDPTIPISPSLIEIKEDGGFSLVLPHGTVNMEGFEAPETANGTKNEASAVWSLAASLFYLVMGCQVMNGKGGAGQNESSKLPYMRSALPLLSELVQHCLNYHPERRPSLQEINALATEQFELCLETVKRGPKFQENSNNGKQEGAGRQNMDFWPEPMKRNLLLVALCLFLGCSLFAQNAVDKETQHLIDIVSAIRQAAPTQRESAWNDAVAAFSKDKSWTIMDEIIPHQNECRLTDRSVQWFSINRILSQQAGYETNQVRGDFNNGENPDFNYSLIERSLKAGLTAEYDLKSREGEQVFVIVPFDPKAVMEVEVSRNGVTLAKGVQQKDGNIYVTIGKDQNVKPKDVLHLTITNKGAQSMAYVLINHNTRK
ncbi:MAG: hypothetical protein IKU00_02525 [Bacteroidales bacterium]|nr:hypothetical protein [Bacteroidales bacterium]